MYYLLCHPQCRYFIPFLRNFEYLLKKNGHDAKLVFAYDANTDNGSDLWFVIWNSLPVLPKRCIIYNMDPMVPHIDKQLHELIQRSTSKTSSTSKILKFVDYCYGSNKSKLADILTLHNIPYKILPYGYSKYHSLVKQFIFSTLPEPVKSDIDILFYGNVSGRRIPLIMSINDFVRRNNYTFMIRNYDLFDEREKILTIARARIIISFASADTLAFKGNDLARSAQVLSSGGFVITEFIGDSTVENVMKEYVPHYSTVDELLELLKHYLSNEAARQAKLKVIAERFPKDFPLEKNLLEIITTAQ